MYQLYYKHHSPIILRVDNIGWQAILPSGGFANARTKAQCVILACLEIDKTEPIEEDLATGKYVSWWQDDPMFKAKEDKQYVSSKNQEDGVDAKLPDIDELIKKLASDEFIEKKIKDILGENDVDSGKEK